MPKAVKHSTPIRFRYFRIKPTALFACLVAMILVICLLPRQNLQAATAFIDPNGDGTIGSNWIANPITPHYLTVSDLIRQPAPPNIVNSMLISNNRTDTAFLQMGTISNITVATTIQVWVYHNDSNNGITHVALYDNSQTTAYGTEQSLSVRSTSSWDSVTFTGLSLNQAQLDGLRLRFRVSKSAGSPSDVTIYAVYAVVTYESNILTADIVDGSGNSVSSPYLNLSSVDTNFDCQTSTGTLGTASQKIRVTNTTTNGNWSLTIAATSGATASWSNGINSFDFNDSNGSPAGCGDGADSDSIAGQMSLNPSVSTVTPQSGCSTSGISKGASTAFNQGILNNLTLLNASGSQVNCYYDFTGLTVSQKIPAETPSDDTDYKLNLTITVTAN